MCDDNRDQMSTAAHLRRFAMAAVLLLSPPVVTAKSEPKPTTPTCLLKCPEGFHPTLYTWELHPERTVYDENGQETVPVDGVWKVSCAIRCEQKVEGAPSKVHTDKTALCNGGAEPAPFSGPWRITGKWVRECAAIQPDTCGFHCYPIKKPPPPKKKPDGKRGKKK